MNLQIMGDSIKLYSLVNFFKWILLYAVSIWFLFIFDYWYGIYIPRLWTSTFSWRRICTVELVTWKVFAISWTLSLGPVSTNDFKALFRSLSEVKIVNENFSKPALSLIRLLIYFKIMFLMLSTSLFILTWIKSLLFERLRNSDTVNNYWRFNQRNKNK